MQKLILSLTLASLLLGQSLHVTGTVYHADTGEPLAGVNLIWGKSGTATDEDGRFALDGDRQDSLIVRYIGFAPQRLVVTRDNLEIRLQPVVLEAPPITVSASRAVAGVSPVAWSRLDAREIAVRYTAEDVPMILNREPGVHAYSESGNGTGYSYVSIRGFDQSRISVMLDNVPLNDNESHQVYWVDHGDILFQAEDVQIQRGLGLNTVGVPSFGGSINVLTKVDRRERFQLNLGTGSYATHKLRAAWSSGERWGRNRLALRFSQVESEGYRDYHDSYQRSGFLGYDRKGDRWEHRFRVVLGKEITHLSWDGIPAGDIQDRQARREGYRAYTDNFLQQIYSWNARWSVTPHLQFRNTLYAVKGAGYYRVRKTNQDYFSYNLDIRDLYPDSVEQSLVTDLTRRKWIVNHYEGVIPTLTWQRSRIRLDGGFEWRTYRGNHYGEVTDFSADSVTSWVGDTWYRYYHYDGNKNIITGFLQVALQPVDRFWLTLSGQSQFIHWELNQERIGHARGYGLSTDWRFFNPRLGASYRLNDTFRLFANVGAVRKEPADSQIIEADDVFGTPHDQVAPEQIQGYEGGGETSWGPLRFTANVYRIDFSNEQLKKIDINQEGEYDYTTAPATIHQGVEAELSWLVVPRLYLSTNMTWARFRYSGGDLDQHRIPNQPEFLWNGEITWRPFPGLETTVLVHHVGDQELDEAALATNPAYTRIDWNLSYHREMITLRCKVNNLLNTLYSTFGYDYEWDGLQVVYWPAATRNAYAEIAVQF
ncbi:MAG: TonB-dependent receptor [Candidatus Neomarinimicrobiota bacterium]|nr:MAG: TonB-dependent receptor [Candidatus Neomarinimicrobiota bacterium]